MKKNIPLIIVGVIIIICSMLGLKETFGAETAVYYDGTAKELSYNNMDDDDFFNVFKDLIPGDTRSQRIQIKTRNIVTNTKLYLKLNKDTNKTILDHINISFYLDGELLQEKNDLVLIKESNKDEDMEFEIVVEVPIEVGNEVADLSYSMSLSFLVEEDDEPPIIKVPNTGENTIANNVVLKISFLGLFIIGLVVLIYGSHSRNS